MRKAVRLSQLLEKIADHVIVKQEHIIGFLLEKKNGELRANPISDLALLHHWGMIILPHAITSMPKSLKQFAEFIELLDTFLHIQMDVPIAGYVALTLSPLMPSNVISKQHIWMALDDINSELTEIVFMDGSSLTITSKQLKLLDHVLDLDVVKTTHAHILTA